MVSVLLRDTWQCQESRLMIRNRGRQVLLAFTSWLTRDVSEHPTLHKTAPHNKESFGIKCQQRQGWEILPQILLQKSKSLAVAHLQVTYYFSAK